MEDKNISSNLTYEEITKLAKAINKLSSAQLDRVVKIIQENIPSVGNDDNSELEIDISSLDTTTLWALHAYVFTAR
jgi:hypothetical protein